MRKTEFVAVGCRDLAACQKSLEGRGWTASSARNEFLAAAGVEGPVCEFRHPEAPFPLLVAEGAEGLRATAVARGGGRGYVWVELIVDDEYQERELSESPLLAAVVEHIVRDAGASTRI